jgi:hypothetical protein
VVAPHGDHKDAFGDARVHGVPELFGAGSHVRNELDHLVKEAVSGEPKVDGPVERRSEQRAVASAISLAVETGEQAFVSCEITSQLGAQGSGLLVSYWHGLAALACALTGIFSAGQHRVR